MARSKLALIRLTAAILASVVLVSTDRVGAAPSGIGQSAAAPAPNIDDRGTFVISVNGRNIGTEKFAVSSSPGRIDAQADIQLRSAQDGRSVSLRSTPQLVLNSQFEPQTYAVNQKGGQEFHLEVNFLASPAVSRLRLAGQKTDDERDFALPKDVVVLDDNVVHHYQILVDRFALKPEKKQTFNAYIPQEAVPGALTVEEIGNEEVDLSGHKVTLRHLVLTTELAQIDLWVDSQQHLQRLYNSSQRIEAVRKK